MYTRIIWNNRRRLASILTMPGSAPTWTTTGLGVGKENPVKKNGWPQLNLADTKDHIDHTIPSSQQGHLVLWILWCGFRTNLERSPHHSIQSMYPSCINHFIINSLQVAWWQVRQHLHSAPSTSVLPSNGSIGIPYRVRLARIIVQM